MHFIPFMRGATAYEGQVGRVCYRVPYWRFMRVGCWPSLYLAPKEPEELPPGTYAAKVESVTLNERGYPVIKFDLSSAVPVLTKPRIYSTYYRRSRRHYWRVSPMPKPYTADVRALWKHAHDMARQMNERG